MLGPGESGAEALLSTGVLWLVLVAQTVAAILITLGMVLTLARLMKMFARHSSQGYETVRLTMARFLALALEFMLAADILATAVAPSWTQIGKLGAIAVIRTALNYFLAQEMKQEEEKTKLLSLETGPRSDG